MFALIVAILAITLSAGIVGYSLNAMANMEYEMAQLHEEVDVLDMRVQRLQLTIEVRDER